MIVPRIIAKKQIESQGEKLQAALKWLDRGALLLPAKSHSKYLFKGFGPHQRQVKTAEEAWHWWGCRAGANLAVLCGPISNNLCCLDFDDRALYDQWLKAVGSLGRTYTEITPRGAHVFFYLKDLYPRVKTVAGAEVKFTNRFVLINPSYHPSGFAYQVVNPLSALLTAGWRDIISFLLSDNKEPIKEPKPGRRLPPRGPKTDLLSRLKTVVSVFDLAEEITKLEGNGRYWRGLCPFHEDREPSFWVDSVLGLWGCFAHGCKAEGVHDVINLYALYHKLDNREAIRRMVREYLR
jgi:hypothetical protein